MVCGSPGVAVPNAGQGQHPSKRRPLRAAGVIALARHPMEMDTQMQRGEVSGVSLYWRWFPVIRISLALLPCILLATNHGQAWGEEANRITVLEENDSLF